ncbi:MULTISPECIES: hypothetical protein [unclassified Rhodococcus (in: high G+C Gram-positive bacteria)]|uniref:hypothetical protein n=2 Tax=Mycobacteriales TaxID=85007 RepID=UPI0002AC8305|nr:MULTISPECIES: hypothetical protein [unclassified Rhodococcus (in: high G+C Gram-positive bacteria)]MCC8930483.1 hypothetical protein [Rhodococcus sp. I2R]CCQ18035.1 putative MerR family transcriptional regulator [Rhodococcus sp. AW25M09]
MYPVRPRPDARTLIRLDPTPLREMKAPSACTLSTAVQPGRIELWALILASVTSRRRVDEGLEFTFPPDTAFIARLSDAIASELACCSFYVFTVNFTATATTMTVKAPGHSAEVVDQLFGDTDS